MLKPARRKVDVEELRRALKRHAEVLKGVSGRREPTPGELAGSYLEEEFER